MRFTWLEDKICCLQLQERLETNSCLKMWKTTFIKDKHYGISRKMGSFNVTYA